MSYSRWSNSRWYAYHSVGGDDTIENELFCISLVKTFTYKEIKEDIEGCLNLAIANEEKECDTNKVTSMERQELKDYMIRFLESVEREYESKS